MPVQSELLRMPLMGSCLCDTTECFPIKKNFYFWEEDVEEANYFL